MEGIRFVPTIEITLAMQCARQTTQMVLSTIARPLSILYPADLRPFTQGDSYNGVFYNISISVLVRLYRPRFLVRSPGHAPLCLIAGSPFQPTLSAASS
jgi:hypothetical protein